MAIDFKGGFTDKRLEPWLYKFNYSEAQQWEFLEDNSKRVFRINKYEKTDINSLYLLGKSKNVLVLNHKFHHKNQKGLEMICNYLDYNLIYGSEKDIPTADAVYCPSHPFNVSKYPNKRFVFGPHLSIFPDNKLHSIQNQNNSVYIQPSPWARDVWINKDAEKFLPVVSFPYPVEVDKFKPKNENIKRNNVLVMFKYRKNTELTFIENKLKSKKESYRVFKYGSYKEEDYKNYLQTCKYGIWIGTHESQGFGVQEALSSDVPLLVWSVTNMNQQENWRGAPDVKATTIGYWDKMCGEYFYKEEEFEKTYQIFLQNLNSYKPREFVLNTVSVKQCAENFKKVFLNKKNKKQDTEYKVLTCANSNYFNALKCFINNFKQEKIDFHKLIVYDIGLTEDQKNELYILQNNHGFSIYKLDFSKYPEHVNLNLEKWSGLNNCYAFKPIIIHKILQNINVPLIYLDCGCGFTIKTFEGILNNICKNNFYVGISNDKNSIESLELNHPDTLNYFNIKNTDIISCLPGILGINYSNNYAKNIIDLWYNYSMKREIISPIGSNRNNHRQDQSVLNCILHNTKYNYNYNVNIPIFPWKYKSINPYYNRLKSFNCIKKNTNRYESIIYTKSLDEAIDCYQKRKNISKELLLRDFIIK